MTFLLDFSASLQCLTVELGGNPMWVWFGGTSCTLWWGRCHAVTAGGDDDQRQRERERERARVRKRERRESVAD